MFREIRLYGQLAKFIGRRVLRADVASAAEAVRFLVANWPEVEQHMADQYYRVSLGKRDLELEEVHDPAGQQVIKIVPVVAGAGAVGKIILGVALVAAAVLIPGAAAWLGPTVFSLIVGVGTSLVLGGVAQLLSPTPTTALGQNQQDDPKKSYSFSGVQNVSRAGVPLPVIFGEVLVGSVVISASIDIDQI